MTMTAGSLEEIAQSVAQRTSEMLGTTVELLDERGALLASSVQFSAHGLAADGDRACIQVPVRVQGRAAHVVIDEPPEGESISPRLARMVVEMAISQSSAMAQLPDQTELKNKFIYDVLHAGDASEEHMLRQAQILGMDFSRPRAVLLIDAAGYIMAWSPEDDAVRMRRNGLRAQHVIASVVSYFRLPSDTICAYIGGGEVAVLKASTDQDLPMWTDGADAGGHASWGNLKALKRASRGLLERVRRDTAAAVSIGVGRYHPGIRGLSRSYQDADAALSLGRRVRGENEVHCLDDLGVAAFMGVPDQRTKAELAAHLLSPLEHERELLDTIAAYFRQNCCPRTTASALGIHRNTLSYRLDKIASLTGLDPRRFDDAVQIRLASVLRSI